ncbi:MAG: cell division protein FtsW, partial [Myxococcota bacterium]
MAATAILACFGIVMVYSTTAPLAIGSALPPYFARHLVAVAAALVCAAVAVRIPISLWRRAA